MNGHHTITEKKCVGMRQSRIPTHKDISVMVKRSFDPKATQHVAPSICLSYFLVNISKSTYAVKY